MDYTVLVTYKDRWHLLERVISAIKDESQLSLIIVSNGSPYDIKSRLAAYQNIHLIHSEYNRGSAWAYAEGLKQALQDTSAECIWLLDDDNLPRQNTLEILRKMYVKKIPEIPRSSFMLMALRTSRKYLINTANGEPLADNFPNRNDFLGVNIFRQLKKITGWAKNTSVSSNMEEVVIPCAPYGGLFFHKSVLDKIGLPDERFFVYADDFEFTYRLTLKKGCIYLITDAKVDDIEETWQHPAKKISRLPNLLTQPGNLVYYSIRNFVYFQNNNLVNNRFIFYLNRLIYTMYLYLLALFSCRLAAFRRYRTAVKDGINGNFTNTEYPI